MAKPAEYFRLQNDIIRLLYFQESQSCAAISATLKKSIPLITRELNVLIEEGYVITNGYAPSTGGRRPLSYSLNPNKGFIVAVAMDQLFTRIVIVDLGGRHVSNPENLKLDLHKAKDALKLLVKMIQAHISHAGIDTKKIIGVGIGMPGFINTEEGVNYTFFDQNLPMSHRAYLEEKLGIPVYIDNDSSLTALAECIFGLAKNKKNAMVINIGWGTGLGIIVDGKLFRGDAGYAGEFSHIPMTDNGILCECGKKGCLETETSLLIMSQKAVNEIKGGRNVGIPLKDIQYMSDVIIDAAHRGNQYCIELLSHVGYMLGKGIAILIHIMNPELIVLSGRGARAEKILMAPVQQALNQYCIPRLAKNTAIAISRLGQDAALVGAAALVVEHSQIFHPKIMTSPN